MILICQSDLVICCFEWKSHNQLRKLNIPSVESSFWIHLKFALEAINVRLTNRNCICIWKLNKSNNYFSHFIYRKWIFKILYNRINWTIETIQICLTLISHIGFEKWMINDSPKIFYNIQIQSHWVFRYLESLSCLKIERQQVMKLCTTSM